MLLKYQTNQLKTGEYLLSTLCLPPLFVKIKPAPSSPKGEFGTPSVSSADSSLREGASSAVPFRGR